VFEDEAVAGIQFTEHPEDGTDDWEPPEYVDMDTVSLVNTSVLATNNCELLSELTVPKYSTEVPGVVIVGGSGPVDFAGRSPRTGLTVTWRTGSQITGSLHYDTASVLSSAESIYCR